MPAMCLCPCRGRSQPSVFRKRRGRSTGLPSADGRGIAGSAGRSGEHRNRCVGLKQSRRPPPLQQGPRCCQVRCLSGCFVGSRRTDSGARSASDYSGSLKLKSKDICYPIDTKNSGTHGRWDLEPVDFDDGSHGLVVDASSISNWTLRLAPLCPIADAKEESQSTGRGSRTHRGMWSLTLCSNLAVKLDLSAVDSSKYGRPSIASLKRLPNSNTP